MKHFSLMGGAIHFMAVALSAVPAFALDEADTPSADTLSLRELTVTSTFSSRSNSPLRLSTIDSGQLRQRAASRTYPEMLKSIPGLYATSESGSYGDAKLNIRGFGQENISVLLNGIPISGLTSGSMYWNNWMGLADATYAIQVQKSVGASMLSESSVGGSVNIITTTTSDKLSLDVGTYGTDYGTWKGFINFNSGMMKHGWGVSFMASYVGGSGYVDMTDVNSYAYMLNVTKTLGEYNTLSFTTLGSPEKHEQRSSRLSWDEVSEYGRKYSKNWGYRDGSPMNLSLNNYFKPYFTLQHFYGKDRLSMKNSVYLAIGDGGGRWTETKDRPISSYMSGGQIDWDAAIEDNQLWDGAESGFSDGIAAQNIMSSYMAGHTQAGAIVSGDYRLAERLKLGFGAHYQYYGTWEKEVITDLLGADYWYEDYENKSLAGLAGRNPIKHVGDEIRTNNGKRINYGTFYFSGEYDGKSLKANLGVSCFMSSIRRWDKYNYTGEDIYSDIASGTGYNVKGGLLYRLGKAGSIYLNGGYYSRLPYSDVWFSSGNNEITEDVRNERNMIGELGYRYVYSKGSIEATGYAVYRKNKSLMSDMYKPLDKDEIRYMVTGLDAFHYGMEIEAFHRFTGWLELSAFASVGDWRWKNDVQTSVYDPYSGTEIQKINIYTDNLPVGDAPQTQVGADLSVKLPKGFAISADWVFNDRMYADFDPASRTDPDDRQSSYRLPSYHLLGATASWSGKVFRNVSAMIFVTGRNLLDTYYIERGKDGADHDLNTFRGYWGFGRNFSFGVRFSLGS